jgi:hypothetical protein
VVRKLRAHVEEWLVIPGAEYIDAVGWDPLIIKFWEFFGGGTNVHPSSPAAAWWMHRQGLVSMS